MVFEFHVADIPAGKPLAPATPLLAIPVAPVVVWVMAAGSALLIQTVGDDDADETVLSGVTVIKPGLLTVPQPPVSSIL